MANIETITVGNTTYDVLGSGYAVSSEYFTTEKVVGTWIDGKPVYQKVYTNLSAYIDSKLWRDTGITGLTYIDKIIYIRGFNNNCTVITNIDRYQIVSNKLQAASNTSDAITLNTIILQYTKTTDV